MFYQNKKQETTETAVFTSRVLVDYSIVITRLGELKGRKISMLPPGPRALVHRAMRPSERADQITMSYAENSLHILYMRIQISTDAIYRIQSRGNFPPHRTPAWTNELRARDDRKRKLTAFIKLDTTNDQAGRRVSLKPVHVEGSKVLQFDSKPDAIYREITLAPENIFSKKYNRNKRKSHYKTTQNHRMIGVN
ncbi:hypothetical protein AAG570_002351 [Ranatra chinensis]|uniref:Uncharacterized protein n=1 Tax=Ranatra chinensis TaxID=642074 RepID=A0ABD0Y7B1_9HEMI